MAETGGILREARESQGLSYKDIENEIKIRGIYLKALEEEDYDELPGMTYTKGFLRTYAKYLKLDEDALVASFMASQAPQEEDMTLEVPRPISTTPMLFRPVVLVGTAIVAVVLVVALSLYFRQQPQNPQSFVPPPLPTVPESTAPLDLPPETETETKPPEQFDQLTIEVDFIGRCWLEVKVDGEIAYRGTRETGQSLLFEANESVVFNSIGNPRVIVIRRNGVEQPYIDSGSPVSNLVFTLEEAN